MSWFTGSGGGSSASTGSWGSGLHQGLSQLSGGNAGQGMNYFSMNPQTNQAIGQSLSQYSNPNYLNVAQNPYVQNLVSSLTSQSNQNLGTQLAGLRSQFGQQGQTSAGSSSPLAQAEVEGVGQQQTNLNNLIAQQLFGQYQQQQGLQLQGLNAESQNNLLPAQLLAQLAPLTGKSKGATQGILGSQGIGGLLQGAGGAASGIAALGSAGML